MKSLSILNFPPLYQPLFLNVTTVLRAHYTGFLRIPFKALHRFLLLETNFPHLIPPGRASAPPPSRNKAAQESSHPATNLPSSPHKPLRILVFAGPHIETQAVGVNFRFHILWCDKRGNTLHHRPLFSPHLWKAHTSSRAILECFFHVIRVTPTHVIRLILTLYTTPWNPYFIGLPAVFKPIDFTIEYDELWAFSALH